MKKEKSDLWNTKCATRRVIMAEWVDPGFSISLTTTLKHEFR